MVTGVVAQNSKLKKIIKNVVDFPVGILTLRPLFMAG
jgi:hypothetical protein